MTQGMELKVNLHQLLKAMIEKGASDMHITTGAPPLLRIDGQIVPLKLSRFCRNPTCSPSMDSQPVSWPVASFPIRPCKAAALSAR